MNQCANAGAASLERCKRAAQSPAALPPHPLSLPLASLISIFLSNSPFLSPFPTPTATYLSYSPSLLCSHSTSLWHVYFLSVFYLIIPPLSCYLICSFHSLLMSFCVPLLYCTCWCHHFYFPPPPLLQFFPCSLPNSLSTLVLKKGERKKKKKSRSHREMKTEKRKKYEERGTSKRGETKSSLLSLWWEKMSEGAIIKLEFFNTVKNGALTAHRQCKGQAPTTHGEPPN